MTNSWTLEDADLVGLDIVASRLALALRPGDAVTLSGPLGAGKTTWHGRWSAGSAAKTRCRARPSP
jgi:tRNA A37 threonylcarbamoyladenosine biosynthesis protein TsaE